MSMTTVYLVGFLILCIIIGIGVLIIYLYTININKTTPQQPQLTRSQPQPQVTRSQPQSQPQPTETKPIVTNINPQSTAGTKVTTLIQSNTPTHTLPPPPPVDLVSRRNILKSVSSLGLRNRAWSGLSESSAQSFSKTPKIKEEIVLLDLDISPEEIAKMRNEHKLIISYSSVGSYEPKREYNKNKTFPSEAYGPKMDSWDEYWLDLNKIYNNTDLKTKVMSYYNDLFKFIANKKFDGVEFDNADFAWNGGKAKDNAWKDLVVKHLKELALLANNNGLLVFMKNGGFLYYDTDVNKGLQRIGTLADTFDGLITEQANGPNDSDEFYGLFTKRGKPWYNFEYNNESKNCKLRFSETMSYFDTGNNGYKQCLNK